MTADRCNYNRSSFVLVLGVHSTVNFPVRQTPSGGDIFTPQHGEEGQMQREAGEGSKAGEMLTFSREQRCIEAAVAAASLPPSLPSPHLPFPPFRFLSIFLSSSVQDDGDETLAVDQNNPPGISGACPPHMLSPLFLSLTHSLFLSLFLFPLFPLFCVCFPAVPAPSVFHSVHPASPASPIFPLPPVLPSSLPPAFSLISSLLLSPPLFTSTPTSKQQK